MTVLAILIIGIAAYLSNSDTPYDPNALDFEMTPVDSFKREVDNFPNIIYADSVEEAREQEKNQIPYWTLSSRPPTRPLVVCKIKNI